VSKAIIFDFRSFIRTDHKPKRVSKDSIPCFLSIAKGNNLIYHDGRISSNWE
jgi:hypothetical protein